MGLTFSNHEERYRRQQRIASRGIQTVDYQGPSHLSRSKRAVLSGHFKPTTWKDIFAEITYCKSCATHYPSPGCGKCEKSMDDMDVPSGYTPKVKTVTHDDSALLEKMRQRCVAVITPDIPTSVEELVEQRRKKWRAKPPETRWSGIVKLILRLRWWR